MTVTQDTAPTPGPATESGAAPTKTPFRHIPALDGLRGAAVLAVLLFHGGLLTGGYLGVDLFFVLSGFLITSLLLIEVGDSGKVALGSFWARRARRLLPALLLVLVGVSLYAVFIARPVDMEQIRNDGLGTLFYVANWHTIIHGSNYWDIALAPSPLQHTWSLAIEEQFYLIWPMVVLLVARAGSRRSVPARVRRFCLAGAAISTALFIGLHAAGMSDTRIYEGTDTRAVALLLGAALAAFRLERARAGRPLTTKDTEAVGIVALVLLAVAWGFLDGQSTWVYRGFLPICSLLATLVLAAAADVRSPVVGSFFSMAPLRWLGMISYGLYLWHWPVFLVLNPNRTHLDGVPLFLLRFAVSVAIAVASYYLLEEPIRRQRWSMPQPAVLAVVCIIGVAALLFASTLDAVNPVQIKESDVVRRASVQVPGAPRMLFVGDSVAASLANPVLGDPKAYAVNPADEAVIGCSPLDDGGHRVRGRTNGAIVRSKPCSDRYQVSIAGFRPEIVVAVFGAPPVDSVEIDGHWVRACSDAYDNEMDHRYRDMIKTLTSGGATVVLSNIAVSSNPWRDKQEPKFVECANKVLRKIADDDPNVVLLDLNAHMCPDGPCEVGDDPDIRADGLHYTGPRGPEVAHWMVEQALATPHGS